MPWSDTHYPAAMRHLPEVTRAKAIEIANALLDEGMDEGRAIRIAIAQARHWAQRHLPWVSRGPAARRWLARRQREPTRQD